MKKVKLKSGQFTIIDDEDFEKVKNIKWRLEKDGYVIGGNPPLRLHRMILGKIPRNMQIDHINRNVLDNRKENLRICTVAQNQMNRGPQKNNNSGLKGVSWHIKKWRASIKINGKPVYLGLYENKIDAARIYNEVAKFVYGDFAWLNPI